MLTAWCMAVVWLGLLAAGTPLACWLTDARDPDATATLLAPFLGLAALVLALQNLVYLNIPLRVATPYAWGVLGLLCGLAAWRGALRERFAPWAAVVLLAAVAVYLLHALGLIAVGARLYVGWGWWDQCYYDGQAQFFQDWRYDTTLADVNRDNLFLAWPVSLKGDRIGQSVLHAFLACSCATDAKLLFGPLSLLLPALTVPAVYLLAERCALPRRAALLAAVIAGTLPALTTLHLASYLSQCLAVPLLLVFPVLLYDMFARPGWRSMTRAALVLAAATAVFTEFLILFLALIVVAALVHLSRRPFSWRPVAWLAAVPVIALSLNPGYLPKLLPLVRRATAAGVGLDALPWAYTVGGWSRLWVGDLVDSATGPAAPLVRTLGLVLAALGYLGLARHCRDAAAAAWVHPEEPAARLALMPAAGILALAVLPLIVLVKDDRHPYQFYKLLLSVSPLLVLGICLLAQEPASRAAVRGQRPAVAPWLVPAAALAVGAVASTGMVLATARAEPQPLSFASIMHSPDFGALQDRLASTRGQDLVLGLRHPYLNSWLTYLGRRHRLHLMECDTLTPDQQAVLRYRGIWDPARMPQQPVVVTYLHGSFARVRPGDMSLEWDGGQFQVWHARSPSWAVPVAIDGPSPADMQEAGPYFWVGGKPTRITLMAGTAGQVTLTGTFEPGPSLPAQRGLRLRVEDPGGRYKDVQTSGGPFAITVPVHPGANDVWLWALDEPPEDTAGDEDPVPGIVGVRGIGMSFRPAEVGPCH
jgi:hypothetical protein